LTASPPICRPARPAAAIRPARPDFERLLGVTAHVGRTVIVVQTDIRDDDEKRVAQVTQTQAILPPAG